MKLPSLTTDSASKFSRLPNKFNRLPNRFTRSSNLVPTVPVGGDIKGTVLVRISTTATPTTIITRSATASVTITATANGQQTDQQYYRSANISVTIEATASGGLTTQTHTGTADCQVNISASANGYNTSDTIPDETTNGNNIVMSGTGWTFNTDAAIGTRSVNFSGGQDFGIIDEPYLSLLRSPWSFSCWYKPSEGNMGGNSPAHLITTDYGGSGSYFKMYHYNQKLRWFTKIGGTTVRDTSSDVFSSGTGNGWSFIVVTLDNVGDPTMYIDGSEVTLSTDSTPNTSNISNYSSTGDIRIGSFSSYSYKIDDVAFWSTELTSTQVSNLYNSGSGTDLTGSSNLAGWWKMGDSNVTSTTHSGTASCQVNLSASASGTASTPVLDNDYAVSCDGTDDYIDLNSNFSSVFNSDFSVAFWINLPEGQPSGSGFGTGSNPNIFGLSNSGNAHRFFGLIGLSGASDAGKLRVYYKAGGTQVHARSASAFFSSGATGWVHVVVTVEEGSNGIKMYKNGSAVSVDEADNSSMSSVTMSNFAGNVDMTFGASNRSGTPNYETDADFDEIAIFNTALSASQVSTIYNNASVYNLDGHSNLEGWWRFEEGSGTSVADSSSNSNTATLVNGPTFSTNAPIVYANDYSLDFDGTNDYLSTSLVTNSYDLKNGFSASLWVKLDDVSTTQDFFGRYGASTGRFYFGITGSNVRAAVGTSFDTSTLSHGMSTGTWYHVAYTFSGGSSGTFTYYLNGSSVGTISFTWTSDSGSYEPMHIGGLKNGSSLHQNPTNGKLDEFALYNSTLSASDITAIYNSGTPVNQGYDSNLVAYWRMEENTGTTVADSSSNSNTATLNNGPTFSTDTP